MAKFPKNLTRPAGWENQHCDLLSDMHYILLILWSWVQCDLDWMFSSVPTRKVKRGEGIRVCPSDHVGDFVHDALLGQILPSMLAVSQSRHHFNSCRSDGEKKEEERKPNYENNIEIIFRLTPVLQQNLSFPLHCIDGHFISLPDQDIIPSQFFEELGDEAAAGTVTQGDGRHRGDFHHQLEAAQTAAD